jgi:eukaryotic-like serine/threonine-protein kinase
MRRDQPSPRTYAILHVIGHGGEAEVRLLRDHRTSKLYAGKFLTAHWDPEARVRFRDEVLRQVRVGGDGVVPVVDYNLECERPFVVLEYMPKGSLADEIRRRGKLKRVDALTAAREIASALIRLHRAGVVHRDVKPGNVLRSVDGRLLLNDLGCAATMSPSDYVTARGFVGTYAYAAPEQHDGFATPASDIYALGVTLLELVTGSSARGHAQLPGALGSLLSRLMNEDPSGRPCAFHAYRELDAAIGVASATARLANQHLARHLLALGALVAISLLVLSSSS